MNIEFWSDIVCPWCGLMDHRLRRAVDRFEHGADVRITHRSFQLHPDLPRDGVTQRRLFEMFGVERAAGEQLVGSTEKLAAAEGLSPYHALDRTLGPTDFAHELLAYAAEQGRGNEIWSAMFRVHFGQARKLWTAEQVLGFAEEVHLDRDGAAEALHSRRYRMQVAADQVAARRRGAHGTPFIVLDGRYSLAGAIGTDELHSAMTAVWQEVRSTGVTPLLPVTGADGVCTPDGCATSAASGN
ncbi:DsbA family oxidoreductase [Pseudonocardia sp. CA-142604]|uniref:DsbA family oxidoreductase n=1 Tax=Pseudonocardia sp. CA-142604 TaxID=3240024 RepID=UPI003D8B120E